MMAKSKNRRAIHENQAGFTLIELLVVVIVLGILALIIVPQITVSTEDARLSTLKTDLGQMRSIVEVYYAQHKNVYPGAVDTDGTTPTTALTADAAFKDQLTKYTDASGKTSDVIDATNFPYGPYIKMGSLPTNPYNDLDTVTVDVAVVDITTRTSGGAFGWKFYAKTGVFMANDGNHDSD